MAALRHSACCACTLLSFYMLFPLYAAFNVQLQSHRMADLPARPDVHENTQGVSSASFVAQPQATSPEMDHNPMLQISLPAADLDAVEEQQYKQGPALPAPDAQLDQAGQPQDVESWNQVGQPNGHPSPSYHVTVQTLTDESGKATGGMIQVEAVAQERCGDKYSACMHVSNALGSYGLDLDWRQEDALRFVDSVTKQIDQQLLSVEDVFNNALAEATEGMLQLENLAFGGLPVWQEHFLGSLRGRKLKQDGGYDVLQLLSSRVQQ